MKGGSEVPELIFPEQGAHPLGRFEDSALEVRMPVSSRERAVSSRKRPVDS